MMQCMCPIKTGEYLILINLKRDDGRRVKVMLHGTIHNDNFLA